MKRLTALLIMIVMLFSVLPASATPYTEEELDGYMQAIYCEQPWALEYPDFTAQFIDVDLDGRKELLSIEVGEENAPKNAHAYAFMDAELSHRGFLVIGKLDVCRDAKTDKAFMTNTVNGVVQRLVYDPETMLISTHDLSEKEVARLESYGYEPLIVTKADWQTIKVYEDCRSLFLPAYQHNDYVNGIPPMNETVDYEKPPSASQTAVWMVAAIVAAAVALATVVFVRSRRVRARR